MRFLQCDEGYCPSFTCTKLSLVFYCCTWFPCMEMFIILMLRLKMFSCFFRVPRKMKLMQNGMGILRATNLSNRMLENSFCAIAHVKRDPV